MQSGCDTTYTGCARTASRTLGIQLVVRIGNGRQLLNGETDSVFFGGFEEAIFGSCARSEVFFLGHDPDHPMPCQRRSKAKHRWGHQGGVGRSCSLVSNGSGARGARGLGGNGR